MLYNRRWYGADLRSGLRARKRNSKYSDQAPLVRELRKEGMTYTQIFERTGVPPNAAGAIVNNARFSTYLEAKDLELLGQVKK